MYTASKNIMLLWLVTLFALAATSKKLIAAPTHTIYVSVSQGMPLSLKTLTIIKELSAVYGYRLKIINDPQMPVPLAKVAHPDKDIRDIGLVHHYPSIAFKRDEKWCGPAIPGHKSKEVFQELFFESKHDCTKHKSRINALGSNKRLIIKNKSQLVRSDKLQTPIQYYFRPMGAEWISFYTGKFTGLANRLSGDELRFQGRYDLISTPDSKYLSIPSPLRFFDTQSVLNSPESALRLKPVLSDRTMRDSYQSLAKLNKSTYRAATAWRKAMVVRDYQEIDGALEGVGDKFSICENLSFATPIISKNGQMVAGFLHTDNKAFTTQVMKIGEDGKSCDIVDDVGLRTGKVDFSYDHRMIVFMALSENGDQMVVYAKQIGLPGLIKVTELDPHETMTFPAFLPSGNVLVHRIDPQSSHRLEEYELH
jgi:hypothetical protein